MAARARLAKLATKAAGSNQSYCSRWRRCWWWQGRSGATIAIKRRSGTAATVPPKAARERDTGKGIAYCHLVLPGSSSRRRLRIDPVTCVCTRRKKEIQVCTLTLFYSHTAVVAVRVQSDPLVTGRYRNRLTLVTTTLAVVPHFTQSDDPPK